MSEFILDTRLSGAHFVLCSEAIRRGIIAPADLNEGRRTIAEQTFFWFNQPPPAAFPSPFAPHILRGKANHALDVESHKVQALANFYREMGVPVALNTVAGEPWHMVFPNEAALLRAAESLRERGGKLVTLKPGVRHADVKALRFRLWDTGVRNTRGGKRYGPALARKVKRFQRKHGLRADGIVGERTWQKLKQKGGKR